MLLMTTMSRRAVRHDPLRVHVPMPPTSPSARNYPPLTGTSAEGAALAQRVVW